MEETLVTFGLGQTLKKLGFNWPTHNGAYNDLDRRFSKDPFDWNNHSSWTQVDYYKGHNRKSFTSIPTLSHVQKWFRIVHKIHIELMIDLWGEDDNITDPCYRAFIWIEGQSRPKPYDDLGAGEYEKILTIALEEAIEKVKNK